ncbi:aldo/keto reductase [Paractinoplanes brasiliensis]|uniref:D-threo-aldose 1-dehydrogenase n=1 Tax=Paractinoplanes brasiliensis TaxID=52695 RepID=A0A4R6JPQ3_9ACTN|nr:aldo/keto reductase [Actinoplanes brasiliensis]TDO36796.1 D-threo-aldose 1-dehydrogenase [Actinoplanes brasiliensis]GID30312.1 oxidoreductase [Actinoplanes brasiliensis]
MTEAIRRLLARGRSSRGVLVLGGSALGNFARAVDDDEAARTTARAWERGLRWFDTAPHYGLGLSERRLGAELRRHPPGEFVVSTKVGRLLVPNPAPARWDTDGFAVPGDLRRRWDFTPSGVERSLEESLSRLGLDAVDIAYVHDPDQAWPGAAREGLASLARLKQAGVVRAVGIGTNATDGLAGVIRDGLVDVVMLANRYSLLDHTGLEPVLTPAREAGVAVVAAGVFATGLLATARPTPGATYEYGPAGAGVVERANRIASVCERHGVELPAVALAFPLLHPAVVAVAVGMRSPGEVDDNLRRFETGIPDGVWRDLVTEGLIESGTVPER